MAPGAADYWSIEREVGATPGEFLRCLRQAAPAPVERLADDRYRLRHAGVELTLSLRVLPERCIAGLVLPSMHVRYALLGDRAAGEALLATLDAGMQRGGG